MRKEKNGMIKMKTPHLGKKLKCESSSDSDKSVTLMDSDDVTIVEFNDSGFLESYHEKSKTEWIQCIKYNLWLHEHAPFYTLRLV